MKKYEDFISDYITKNAASLNGKAPSKKRLIKFSEAVTRAIMERKTRDTGYGELAERLAKSGLSNSGYSAYLSERQRELSLDGVKSAAEEKLHSEALDTHDERVEKERLEAERLKAEEEERLRLEKEEKARLEKEEKEKLKLEKEEAERLEKEEKDRLAAEKKEAERLEKEAAAREKNKKTVLSFAEANKVTDSSVLYTYALSLGLSDADAKEVSEAGARGVREKIRLTNIEKVREYIVLQRFTDAQAYAYAIQLGLEEADAKELADFAYKLNQDTEAIFGEKGNGGAENSQIPPKAVTNATTQTKK